MAEVTGSWKRFMDKRYFGEWDIDGDEMTVTIDHAERNDVINERGTEQKLTVHLRDGLKPLIVNATIGQSIETALGSKNVEDWKGRKIILFREHGRWFGKEGDAVRVRPFAPKEAELFCEECGSEIKASNNMTPKKIAEGTKKTYGKRLCWKCAEKAREAKKNGEG